MGRDDTAGNRESKAGSPILMGNEGFKDGRKVLGVDAASVVGDDYSNHSVCIVGA